jgi:hypothetical protein
MANNEDFRAFYCRTQGFQLIFCQIQANIPVNLGVFKRTQVEF